MSQNFLSMHPSPQSFKKIYKFENHLKLAGCPKTANWLDLTHLVEFATVWANT